MDRRSIRNRVLAGRRQMKKEELDRLGDLIAGQVLQAEWYRNAHCVHCFFGVTEKGEISTGRILADAIASGKVLVLPKVTGDDGGMNHVRVEDLSCLQPGPWDIPEPSGEDKVGPGDIDLVLVPGLAVDLHGNRIGYGKGYYDRFLAEAERAVKVMLVPERFVYERIPAEDHDVPVGFIVTESGIHTCND
jgi:5-formyltetrahydrofolate cyclo-ligase